MGKKSNKEEPVPQEVLLRWANRDHHRTMLYASVFQVASNLTEVWFSQGKKPESPDEIFETFTKMYENLDAWYNGMPLKDNLKKMLDNLYPEPPGYYPGETLLERPSTPMPEF